MVLRARPRLGSSSLKEREVEEDIDHGISGAKGRDKRPAFERLMIDCQRRRFDGEHDGRFCNLVIGLLQLERNAPCALCETQRLSQFRLPMKRRRAAARPKRPAG
jgi:hypothetical protein